MRDGAEGIVARRRGPSSTAPTRVAALHLGLAPLKHTTTIPERAASDNRAVICWGMTRFVVEGAVCRCELGSNTAPVSAGECPATRAGGSTALNISDTRFLATFGDCRREVNQCIACTPQPVGLWANGAPTVQFGLYPVLVETATLECGLGGVIHIEDPGQDNTRFDATYVREDGVLAILNGVTRDELEQYKQADQLQTDLTRIDHAREAPLQFWLGEALGGLVEGAGKAAEQRNNNLRNGRPIRSRGR